MTYNHINFITGEGIENIARFPDGDIQPKLKDLNRKYPTKVTMRLKTPEDFFLLLCLTDIVHRQELRIDEVYFPYFMSMRNDRVMNFASSFNLKVIGNMIDMIGADHIRVLTAHDRDAMKHCIKTPIVFQDNFDFADDTCISMFMRNFNVLAFPDEGACKNFQHAAKYFLSLGNGRKVIWFKKDRITEQFTLAQTDVNLEGARVLVVDDLCDGGWTFGKIAEKLNELGIAYRGIMITHLIQEKGLVLLLQNYDEVVLTNSFKDWKTEAFTNIGELRCKSVQILDVLKPNA